MHTMWHFGLHDVDVLKRGMKGFARRTGLLRHDVLRSLTCSVQLFIV